MRRSRLIELMMGAFSVIIGFNLDLPGLLGNLAAGAGFTEPSLARSVIVNGGVPFAVIVMTITSISVYHKLIWPFWPGLGCCTGLWLYVLMAHTEGKDYLVGGWFRMEHTPHDIRITEALAYYLDGDDLTFRGEWASEAVWTAPRRLTFAFNMVAQGMVREPMPSQYQGLMQLTTRTRGTHGEKDLWTGYFHDLGDRRGVHGPVAGVRARRFVGRRSPEEHLLSYVPRLRETVLELVGATVVALPRNRRPERPPGQDQEPHGALAEDSDAESERA